MNTKFVIIAAFCVLSVAYRRPSSQEEDFVLVEEIPAAHRLNEYISHYELLSYDSADVQKTHLRAKRSVVKDNAVHLSFHAHGRDFKIRLKRDLTVFSDNFQVYGTSGLINVDTSHIYQGQLIDDPNSSVYGSLMEGVFEGKIVSSEGSYYVEKAHHYFPDNEYPNRTFHSVIYRENHIQDPYEDRRDGHGGGCGITDKVIQWMDQIQNSAVKNDAIFIPTQKLKKHYQRKEEPPHPLLRSVNNEDTVNKYSRKINEAAERSRHKRATRSKEKKTCSLYIETDPYLWKHIKEGFPEHADPRKETKVNQKTRTEIMSLIAQHVNAVNYIYSNAKFDGRSEHRNIKFEIQRLEIRDDHSCQCIYPYCELNEFCKEDINASNYLNMYSLRNHEDFCLAYLFTYRDFTGGTLSLAWVASHSGASGGICEKYKNYIEVINGTHQSTKRSLNTGIITFANYNSRVPPSVSQLTFAHAIGHNFGSPHDYPSECRPGGLNGNYIMFASATSGDRPNNSKFSSCSVSNISNNLDAIEQHKKRNCFTYSATAFCGNKIVEPGEECDCGFDGYGCFDKCCYPRMVDPFDIQRNASAKGCNRKRNTQCSPSEGPCCNEDTCLFIPSHKEQICKSESDCSISSKCNGISAECPLYIPRPDKTRCNNGTQLCISGECTESICLEWNLTACFLTTQDHSTMDKRKLCELACQNGTDVCRSTSEFAHLVGLPQGGISLRPGSPCYNFQGYCNQFLQCIAVDTEVVLFRSENLLSGNDVYVGAK